MIPFSEVNLLAVVVAVISCIALGTLWYGPLFGKPWMELNGIKMPAKIDDKVKKMMMKSYILGILNSFVLVYVIALLILMNPLSQEQGPLLSVLSWLGFSVTTKAADAIWAGKPWKLVWIDIGYTFVAILLSGVILVKMS